MKKYKRFKLYNGFYIAEYVMRNYSLGPDYYMLNRTYFDGCWHDEMYKIPMDGMNDFPNAIELTEEEAFLEML